jgi:hypothetical protein
MHESMSANQCIHSPYMVHTWYKKCSVEKVLSTCSLPASMVKCGLQADMQAGVAGVRACEAAADTRCVVHGIGVSGRSCHGISVLAS